MQSLAPSATHPRLVALTKVIYVAWFIFFIRLIFRLAMSGQGECLP